jgi:hypothetical protein
MVFLLVKIQVEVFWVVTQHHSPEDQLEYSMFMPFFFHNILDAVLRELDFHGRMTF